MPKKKTKRTKNLVHMVHFSSQNRDYLIICQNHVSMPISSRYLARYLVAIYKIQMIAYRRMSKAHIVYIFLMLTIPLLSVSSKSISNITGTTQDDRIMELENAVRILDTRVQLLNETTHKGM
jgi:hypothetical protein